MLANPAPRKMLVAIGTLKNVGYLDRISNRISLSPRPLMPISFRIVPFPTPYSFFTANPFRLQFRPHSTDVENEFLYQSAIWCKKKYPLYNCSYIRLRSILTGE